MGLESKDIYTERFSTNGYPLDTNLTNIGWSLYGSSGNLPTGLTKTNGTIGDSAQLSKTESVWYSAQKIPEILATDGELSGRFAYVGDRVLIYFRVFNTTPWGTNNGHPVGCYWLMVGTGTNFIQLHRINNNNVGLVTDTYSSFDPTDFNLRVRFEGANFKAYIDDVEIVNYTDASPIITPGTIGFGSWNSTMYVTDFKLRSL